MPRYDFLCSRCHEKFEQIVSCEVKVVLCPMCHPPAPADRLLCFPATIVIH